MADPTASAPMLVPEVGRALGKNGSSPTFDVHQMPTLDVCQPTSVKGPVLITGQATPRVHPLGYLSWLMGSCVGSQGLLTTNEAGGVPTCTSAIALPPLPVENLVKGVQRSGGGGAALS